MVDGLSGVDINIYASHTRLAGICRARRVRDALLQCQHPLNEHVIRESTGVMLKREAISLPELVDCGNVDKLPSSGSYPFQSAPSHRRHLSFFEASLRLRCAFFRQPSGQLISAALLANGPHGCTGQTRCYRTLDRMRTTQTRLTTWTSWDPIARAKDFDLHGV